MSGAESPQQVAEGNLSPQDVINGRNRLYVAKIPVVASQFLSERLHHDVTDNDVHVESTFLHLSQISLVVHYPAFHRVLGPHDPKVVVPKLYLLPGRDIELADLRLASIVPDRLVETRPSESGFSAGLVVERLQFQLRRIKTGHQCGARLLVVVGLQELRQQIWGVQLRPFRAGSLS